MNNQMSRTRFWMLYTASWLVFALLYTLPILSGSDMSTTDALTAGVSTVVPAALLGIGVWRLCSVVQRTAGGHSSVYNIRFIGIHVLSALVYTGIWCGMTVYQIAVYAPASVLHNYIARALGWELLMGALLYSVVAGIAYLVQANRRLVEQRALAARAELQALRAQLDPHFLFNTLHSITALVRSDPATVEDALVRFGSLLRYVLDASRQTNDDVPLDDELTFVRSYLALEQLRLGTRLRVSEEVEADTLECLIPSLTLQPLIENAVRHGIAPRAIGGTIWITTRVADDRLLIEVRDDGVGASPERVCAPAGLGLALVRQRLVLRFQGLATMEVDTGPDDGFRVCISVPAEAMLPHPRAAIPAHSVEDRARHASPQHPVTSIS